MNLTQLLKNLSPQQSKWLKTMHVRFHGAMHFLESTLITQQEKKIPLSQLPWYLLIGPQGAGKTSLLANANVNFLLSKQYPPDTLSHLKPSETIDWWATRDLTLVDIPGHYLFSEGKQRFLWEGFLQLVRKHRPYSPLQGVVINLHLPELVKAENHLKKEAIWHPLRQAILELKSRFGENLPFYFVITKCDLIPGFLDFFSDLSEEEASKAWGITVPPLTAFQSLPDVLAERLDALIKRLNNQLLSRLHQEKNPIARSYIKDFPLHIERLKNTLIQGLKIKKLTNLNLAGIYLTSSLQPLQKEELPPTLTMALTDSSQQIPSLMMAGQRPHRPYFIKQLLTEALRHRFTPSRAFTPPSRWHQRFAYTFAIFAIIGTAVLMGQDFQQGIQRAYALQSLLSQYQLSLQQNTPETHDLTKALPLVDALQQAAVRSDKPLTTLEKALTFYSNRSQKTADRVYTQALQTIIVPFVKNYLESALAQKTNSDPVEQYGLLTAYLMLDRTLPFDATIMNHALTPLLPNALDANKRTVLIHHLENAIDSQASPLNALLIQSTRKSLLELSPTTLALVIIKNKNDNNEASAIDLKNLPAFSIGEGKIPNLYTARYFNTILSTDIPLSVKEVLNGNLVLGTHDPSLNDAHLQQTIVNAYTEAYANFWENKIATLQLAPMNTLDDVTTLTAFLSADHSPLLTLLATIQQNTSLPAIIDKSPQAKNLNALLETLSLQNNKLYRLMTALRELHSQLRAITTAPHVKEAAFLNTRMRMHPPSNQDTLTQLKTLSDDFPETMKTWILKLTDNTWRLMLAESAHYIEDQWKSTILSSYQPMASRFPFNPKAEKEVNLSEFTEFFSPKGKLDQFYLAFLKPFTNDSTDTWDWAHVDNRTLPLNKDILSALQYTRELQQAVFPNNDGQLFVSFTLEPVAVDRFTNAVNLSIHGQTLSYERLNPRTPRTLSWPGNRSIQNASLKIITHYNRPLNHTMQGDWAWLRLASSANQTVISRKETELSFSIDSHTAKYLLFTQTHLNPFILSNWEKWQLPEELA